MPQQQQAPRAELFEYPTERPLTYVELLNRRLSNHRDYMMRIVETLNVWKVRRAENPSQMIAGKDAFGQPSEISITALVKVSMDEVRKAALELKVLEEMYEQAQLNTLDSNWSSEALTAPLELFVAPEADVEQPKKKK